jgi:hypothetical protein
MDLHIFNIPNYEKVDFGIPPDYACMALIAPKQLGRILSMFGI